MPVVYQVGPALRAGRIKNETLRTATERHPYPSANLSTFFSPPAPVARFHFSTFAPFHFCTTSLFALHLSATLAHSPPKLAFPLSPCQLAHVPPKSKVFGKEWADNLRASNVEKLRAKLSKVLDDRTSFTFEIGSGHGHWLAAYAKQNPDEFCLGIDLITERIAKCHRKQSLGQIPNIAFLKAEATEVLDALAPEHRLAKIFILYPDPWPKRRHHKNRFINAENLSRLADHATPNALLHFRTDDPDYYAWTVAELQKHPSWTILDQKSWPFETPTFFEELLKAKNDVIAVKTGAK